MSRKTKTTATADKAPRPQISAELLEQLIPGPVTPMELENIFQQFKKSMVERALGAEMSYHLGYAAGQAKPEGAPNHRNGKSSKTVLTDAGSLRIDVPRDREGSFEPQLIGLRPALGGRSSRRWSAPGAEPGIRSFRSSPSRPRCGV